MCRASPANLVGYVRLVGPSLDHPWSFDHGTAGAPDRYRIVLHGSTPVELAALGRPRPPVVPRCRDFREVHFRDCRSRLPWDETTTDLSGRFVRHALLARPARLRRDDRFDHLGVPKPHRIDAAIAAPDLHGPDLHGPVLHGPGPDRRRMAGQNGAHEGRRGRTHDRRGERRSGRRTDVRRAVPHRLREMDDPDPQVGSIRPYLEMIRIQTVTVDHHRGGHRLSGDHPSIGTHPTFQSGCRAPSCRVPPVVGRNRAPHARPANPRFDGRIPRPVRCSPTRADSERTAHPTTRRGDPYDPRNLVRRLPLVGLIGMVAAA